MDEETKYKLEYLKRHQDKLRMFQAILQVKEFNIYEFVSVFNPLINTLLTAILLFTDNLKIIAIITTTFNILISLYLSVHKYYLTQEIPLENQILLNNSKNILTDLCRLENYYKYNTEYNLKDYQDNLYQTCLNTEAELHNCISAKKYQKFMKKYMKNITIENTDLLSI